MESSSNGAAILAVLRDLVRFRALIGGGILHPFRRTAVGAGLGFVVQFFILWMILR